MAKLGYLYLHEGAWDGQQIIPSSWVDRVRQGPVTATEGFHYGNLWWSLPERGAFMARGRHSQIILVLPKLDIVAVLTGVLNDDEFYPMGGLIDDIAGAVKADAALPPDPAGQSLLAASIQKAATEKASPVGATPELANSISGKSYRLSGNDLRVKTFSLNLVDPNPSCEITTATERLDRPTARFAGPIGLDGFFRKGSARYGINAVKGNWLDDHTFVVERRILGHGEMQRWTLAFDGRKVDIKFEDTDGDKADLRGEADE
jgi:hypothetical protein